MNAAIYVLGFVDRNDLDGLGHGMYVKVRLVCVKCRRGFVAVLSGPRRSAVCRHEALGEWPNRKKTAEHNRSCHLAQYQQLYTPT